MRLKPIDGTFSIQDFQKESPIENRINGPALVFPKTKRHIMRRQANRPFADLKAMMAA